LAGGRAAVADRGPALGARPPPHRLREGSGADACSRRGGDHESHQLSLALGRGRGARARRRPPAALGGARARSGPATENKPADPWLAFVAVVARRDMATGESLGEGERLT